MPLSAWQRRAALLAACLALALAPSQASDHAEVRRENLREIYEGPPAGWPAAWIDDGVRYAELRPRDRPPPASPALAALGERLFHDKRLSAGGDVACSSCHDPAAGFTVRSAVARGHRGAPGRRNPPSLATAAGRLSFGWDGGHPTLEARALAPLTDPTEMANPDLDAVLERLRAEPDRREAFGAAGPTEAAVGAALAAFLSGLDGETRFDRFLRGDGAALGDREIEGLHLFRTKARCANCHFGPLLTDEDFHNLKISSFGEPAQDLGRHIVSGRAEDAGRFRTPSLRHVAETAPYMHNGLFPTLEGVLHLYDRGGGEVWARNAAEAAHPLYPAAARLSPHIRPLGLTDDEKASLAAFLRAL
ncbi:cytochrome-c peroxidase [Methylopila henanensis]|uniref:Cytochrome-c peroxidase n=1 Tax=Methylopila henanensis TaxID=873516 RepID=A0ABW4K8Y9_9HYPH